MRVLLLISLMFLVAEGSFAQLLKGKVMDAKSDVPVAGATIYNLSQRIYKKASYTGEYSIIAMAGDSIIYSSAGYRADTLQVSAELMNSGMDVGLQALPVTLETVTIHRGTYADDSVRRRNEYAHFYSLQHHSVLSGNRPATGFGLSLSPFTFFSKEGKMRRRFRKQLEENERQAYIDYNFSPSYVHRLTGLSGDKLYEFMRKYRPSYEFVRNATSEDIFAYINAKMKEFNQRK